MEEKFLRFIYVFLQFFQNIIEESGANISSFELHVVFMRQVRPINLRVPHWSHVSAKCEENFETPFGNPEEKEKHFYKLSQKMVIRSAFFAKQVQFREFWKTAAACCCFPSKVEVPFFRRVRSKTAFVSSSLHTHLPLLFSPVVFLRICEVTRKEAGTLLALWPFRSGNSR